MSAQATSARPAKNLGAALEVEDGRVRIADHAEIVRMAAAVAANHAAERREMIATAAYFQAQRRGFEPGHELEDWFAAETAIAHPRSFETL